MPQLNKGGKFVFGLSLIHDDLTVQFPTQALEEYQVLNDDKIIIFKKRRYEKNLKGWCKGKRSLCIGIEGKYTGYY